MTTQSNQFATILADIAAQAAVYMGGGGGLCLKGQSRTAAALDFAWWSVGTDGDATEDGGDFSRHFRAWARERQQDVRQEEAGG